MTIFEMSVYAPTIEEAWKQTGISRLKIEGSPNKKWAEAIEAVVYASCKYVSSLLLILICDLAKHPPETSLGADAFSNAIVPWHHKSR